MLLVDVYNVLHVTGVLPPDLAGLEVAELAKLIAAGRYNRLEVVLVCDGTGGGMARAGVDPWRQSGGRGVRRHGEPASRRHGTVSIVYAGAGMEADSIIEFMIRGAGWRSAPTRPGRRWEDAPAGRSSGGIHGKSIVVSSDRRVRSAARRAGARSVLSEDFLQQLVDDWRRPAGGARKPSAGADDRPGFARKTPLDRYSVEEWMLEFGFGVDGPTQAEWDDLLDDMKVRGGQPRQAGEADHNDVELPSDSRPPADRRKSTMRADGDSPRKDSAPGSGDTATPPPDRPPSSLPDDPITRAAMKAWPGRINPDDFDMEKWIQDDERLKDGP